MEGAEFSRAARVDRRGDADRRAGEIGGGGRGAALIVDDAQLVAFGAEAEHRAHEIIADGTVDPRGAQDHVTVETFGDRRVTLCLARAVDRQGGDRIVLAVGACLGAVIDVIGGEMDERGAHLAAGLGERGGTIAINRESRPGIAFRRIHRGVGPGIDDDARADRGDGLFYRAGLRQIDLLPLDEVRGKARGPGGAGELVPDLADPADDEDLAAHLPIVPHARYLCLKNTANRFSTLARDRRY
jgi:hypothetical protein